MYVFFYFVHDKKVSSVQTKKERDIIKRSHNMKSRFFLDVPHENKININVYILIGRLFYKS